MPLVNALQNNSPEMFNQQVADGTSRFSKIRSIWPFPVRSEQASRAELPPEDDDESVPPSSFIT